MNNYRRGVTKHVATTSSDEPMNTLSFWETLKLKISLLDYRILIVMTLLILIGIVMVFSSTMYLIEPGATTSDPFGFLTRQFIAISAGYIGIVVTALLPFKLFENINLLNIGMMIVSILLVFTYFIGVVGGGARSWIVVGPLSFQPSELTKIMSILIVSWLLKHYERLVILSRETISHRTTMVSVSLIAFSIVVILIQPDFGMVALIIATLSIIWIQNRFSTKMNLIIVAVVTFGFMSLTLFSHIFSDALVDSDWYQFQRIGSFSNPFLYPQTYGYQLINGYLAFSRGGWFGVGLGQGLTKRGALPAGHTDFILAVIGEEFGLIGVMVVIGLLFLLIYYLFVWAAWAKDTYRRNALVGIAAILFIQSFINLAGIGGLIPLTGVTLPFVSYGGTSIAVSMIAIGIAQAMIIQEKLVQLEDNESSHLSLVHSSNQQKEELD